MDICVGMCTDGFTRPRHALPQQRARLVVYAYMHVYAQLLRLVGEADELGEAPWPSLLDMSKHMSTRMLMHVPAHMCTHMATHIHRRSRRRMLGMAGMHTSTHTSAPMSTILRLCTPPLTRRRG